jgi:uncharacterized membrane protein YkvA (DUF1232 family)
MGRKQDARAWAGFIPDRIILFKRLVSDPKVPRSSKLWLSGLILYLAMPFDLVPDFIPIAGQLDDAIIVALVLRQVLRKAGEDPIRQHWPGPQSSLDTLMKFVKPSAALVRRPHDDASQK